MGGKSRKAGGVSKRLLAALRQGRIMPSKTKVNPKTVTTVEKEGDNRLL